MPKLIKSGKLAQDDWRLADKESEFSELDLSGTIKNIVPLKLWLENKEALGQNFLNIAVWLDSDESPEELGENANNFSLIALNFPVFRDGRSFSHAAILRQQLNYQGELRAIGDVRRDQASYMLSCGFDSFNIPDDVDTDEFLAGLHDFSENYQSTSIRSEPLFRRR